MDEIDYHSRVGDALALLIDGLSPFVERVFAQTLSPELTWTSVLERKDKLDGRRGGVYSPRDLSLLLRAMTERLGDLGYPFDRDLPRQGQNYASELRQVRNEWAHNERFTAQSAYRALDSAELLLRMVGATTQASEMAGLKSALLPAREPDPSGTRVETTQTMSATTETPADHRQADSPSAAKTATITLTANRFLSYAMAHCRISVVSQVEIQNNGPESRGASLEIEVFSALGSHGGPKVQLVDLAENASTVMQSVDLVLDPAQMLAVDEQRPGTIRATLRNAAGGVLGETTVDVEVLASAQWVATPLNLGLEMLAAHVHPNAPVISSLLTEASTRLGERTGRSSLDGYQTEDPARVDAMVEAVYDAMRARDIRYAMPPASWGFNLDPGALEGFAGQKVRTPSEVLVDRLGTCLDTTVTLAAALEQAGINTTMWLQQGHIFLGYWRVNDSLPAPAQVGADDIVNLVDLDAIGLVETTMLTGGTESADFTTARRRPRADLEINGPDSIVGVVDIRQARQSRIYPLPSRSTNEAGETVVTTYQPAAPAIIAPYVGEAGGSADRDAEVIPARVAQWKNALLDLSLRNKLINYTDRAGYSLAVPPQALARFEDAVNANTPITLKASDDVPSIERERGLRYGRDLPESERELLIADKKTAYVDVTSAAYVTKLRYLANKAKTIVQETGANNLYLAFGMLHWRFNDRDLRSPLVLVPVTLQTANRGDTYRLVLDDTGASTPNYCLLEKLRLSFGLSIPGLANPSEDASGIDLHAAFTATREAIASAGLPFRVEDTVDLSILQFAKYRLWKDLDENWETLAGNSLVRHLIESPLEQFVDPVSAPEGVDLDELGAVCPVPADSSQLEAISEAVGDRTFVLEGPPGTGKSQTITNLLARSLAEGKRVLFVAEKRAALDVVKKRLDSVGLGDLSLDLHDKGARPAAVRAQIKAALDLRVHADQAAFRANSEAGDTSRRTLARYADRLHEENAAGLSLYTARVQQLAADPNVTALSVPEDLVANSTPEVMDGLRGVFRRLPETADLARPAETHAWGFVDEKPGRSIDSLAVHTAARAFDDAVASANASGITVDALDRARTADRVRAWAQVLDAPRFDLRALDAFADAGWMRFLTDLERGLTELGSGTPAWKATFEPFIVLRDVPAIHAEALAADQSSFFGRKKRRKAVLAKLSDAARVDPSTITLKTLSTLTAELLASYEKAATLRSNVERLPLPVADRDWNPFVEQDRAAVAAQLSWIRWLAGVIPPVADDEHLRDVRSGYADPASKGLVPTLTSLADSWDHFFEAGSIEAAAVTAWVSERGFVATWLSTRGARNLGTTQPVTLDRWLDLVRAIEPLRTQGLIELREDVLRGRVVADDAALAFDLGIAAASISEREEATVLGQFELASHEKTITRFTSSTHSVRAELPRIIPADVLSKRRFSAGSDTGQVGGLRRQLDRQRGGMSVRALLDNFGELITSVLPCTLMSPESVARFFPAHAGLFDIVVFDEASQIRVADAVGAMGRATSVVVVGDSKQMPPTTFAESNASIDDEPEAPTGVVEDEESILTECVQARVPSKWLSWHYRSQDESLISFSNHHYYESRLSSFPAPMYGASTDSVDGHGISFVRINGQFNRSGKGKDLRTNQAEATAIVDDIKRRFWASPTVSPSVGVITFNAQQRNLIENMLRDSGDDRILAALDEPDGLFVKNLENVQGDERDCILFSIAFSVNDRGVLPLNFGPLSRAGGERRLNVAVTRARRQVVLFASFDPETLRSHETSSVGIKHLRSYLDLAHRGVEAASDDNRRQSIVDHHRDDIANELRYRGFAVRTDVGLSDFRVDISVADPDEPDIPILAVLLDGPNWRSRRTVADRDGLPVDVLKGLMRWPGVERVWLPEWLHHRDETVQRIAGAVETAKAEAAAPITPSAEVSAPATTAAPTSADPVSEEPLRRDRSRSAVAVEPVQVASAPLTRAEARSARERPRGNPLVSEFTEWVPRERDRPATLDELPRSGAARRVQSFIRQAVHAEGPIHADRLAKLVGGAFGLNRVAQTRIDAILRYIPEDYRPRGEKSFVWSPDVEPSQWFSVRTSTPGSQRVLTHIPLVEIANAMMISTEASAGLEEIELKRAALSMFGISRLTPAADERLTESLEYGLTSGRLERTTGGLVVSGRR